MVRKFESGATRNPDTGKLEHAGFNSSVVDLAYAKYMHTHRILEDGTMRDSDNWKAGFPIEVVSKSIGTHYMDMRLIEDGYTVLENDEEHTLINTLMAMRFNINAYLHELLKNDKVVERNYKD